MEITDRPTIKVSVLKAPVAVAVLFMFFFQAGCNKSPFPVAKVSGTIKTEDGAVLPNGRITFTPQARNDAGLSGKSAFGAIENGKFVLSTYGNGDGAVVGQHRVLLSEAYQQDEEYVDENNPNPPRHGCEISPAFQEVEVVPGANVFELIAVRKAKQNINEETDD
jgi:hypothetical protein